MRSRRIEICRWVALSAAVGLVGLAPQVVSAATGRTSAGWQPATKVGVGLNNGYAGLQSVSCTASGDCTAVGSTDWRWNVSAARSEAQALVASESGGVWRKAQRVATQLNVGDDAGLNAVACTSPGNCVAVGSAETSGKDSGALVVEEIGGRWNAGKIVAPTLRRGGVAFLESVSCASFGNCTAVGATTSSNDVPHPLVVTELGGEWGSGKELPVSLGIGDSTLSTVMCPAPSDCAAAGSYVDVHSGTQAFVDSMSNGVWSAAKPVGQAFTTSSHEANLTSVSCNAVGDCVAVGYSNRFTASVTVVRASPLAVVEVKGVWGKGVEVAKALNSGGQGELDSVSCPKRVTCTAVGMYTLRDGHAHPLGVTEVNGSWGAPLPVAGTIPASYQAFNNYGDTLFDSEGDLDSISCPAPRNCEALFSYMSNQGIQVAVASRLLGGEWTQSSIVGQNLIPARVDNARGAPYVVPFAVSCSAPDECSAVGNYGWSGVKGQAFAVNLR